MALILVSARASYAQNTVSQSATIKTVAVENSFDYRVENLKEFLEKYNSPLAPYASDFVAYADKYGLDYRMVPAITGVESTFGKKIPANSFNAYGWANGNYSFKSWTDSIQVVSMTLKQNYLDKGKTSVKKIARTYAPPSSSWASKVNYFMKKIEPIPAEFDI